MLFFLTSRRHVRYMYWKHPTGDFMDHRSNQKIEIYIEKTIWLRTPVRISVSLYQQFSSQDQETEKINVNEAQHTLAPPEDIEESKHRRNILVGIRISRNMRARNALPSSRGSSPRQGPGWRECVTPQNSDSIS